MIFTNHDKIAISEERKKVLHFAEHGIITVLPRKFMREKIKLVGNKLKISNDLIDIKNKRIFVIGAGKASAMMAVELEKILGIKKIIDGIVVTNDKFSKPKKIKIHLADHPIPSSRGTIGVKKILNLKKKYNIDKNDLIISLLSGGGSSLAPLPADGVTLDDKIKMVNILISSGANVNEMTTLKKKISKVKGGKLAQYFFPTPIISLILSDVVGDNPTVIASGPLTFDTTSFQDAWKIIKKYRIEKSLPKSIISLIEKNKFTKNLDQNFSHVKQYILANNHIAIESIKKIALKENLKIQTEEEIEGEVQKIAQKICLKILSKPINEPSLFLFGGECTVTLPKIHGEGGRNQEFALSFLNTINKLNIKNKWCLASIATDGIDFIKESSGAIVDNYSFKFINRKKLKINEYLKNHNSYNFLKLINSNIKIGRPTGTNVCDLIILLILPK